MIKSTVITGDDAMTVFKALKAHSKVVREFYDARPEETKAHAYADDCDRIASEIQRAMNTPTTGIDYSLLNEQARRLYDAAFESGRAIGTSEESTRLAREAAENVLTHARRIMRVAIEVRDINGDSTVAGLIADQARYLLNSRCPVTYSPNLRAITDATRRIESLARAVELVDEDLRALESSSSS
jgi:hypothetical protein